MRRALWVALLVPLLRFLPAGPAAGWTVTEIKTKTLPIAGTVTFTSSFRAADGETITLQIWPSDNRVTIRDVVLTKVTPRRKQGCDGCSIDVSGTGDHDADVTLHNPRPGKSTFHLWLYLSTGEHVGVNVHFGR